MEPLLGNLVDSSSLNMMRNATWTLSNLCKGKHQCYPAWEQVAPALPTLARLIFSHDEEVLIDACWALSYLSDGSNERIQAIIEAGVVCRVVELLSHSSPLVQTPALRTVGNIATGDDLQTQVVINASVLPCLTMLLNSPQKGIKREACRSISNISAGNKDQIQAVIDVVAIPRLIELLGNSPFDVKKEAAWALRNVASGGSIEQIEYIVECNLIPPLCELLVCNDAGIVLVALEGLEKLLQVGQNENGTNEHACKIVECDGLDKIDSLQHHLNNAIYSKSVYILETYFGGEEEYLEKSSTDRTNGCYYFGI
eukprot:TRINITY_DN9741_c0_g1_i2.p1 TRINITY_DN9741_c0_g1~~TRINITY_DN9741_c0_g1_i2.p1  ORF type:complete len:312 (-),score=42.58 TRINITY_DN9741_c0_g1_i2:18-953(-)